MTSTRVHLLARGRVYSGRQAHKIDLIDTLGSLETAIDRAAERAEIPRERAQIGYYSTFAPSLRTLILGTSSELRDQLALLDIDLPEALTFYQLLQQEPVLAYFDGVIHPT